MEERSLSDLFAIPQREINYDDEDLLALLGRVGSQLDIHGICAFTYAAFGTRHGMLVLDSGKLVDGNDSPVWVGAPPQGIGHPGEDRYTLWLREGHGNGFGGPWLGRGFEHVPPYLAEKFEFNLLDGYGLGIAILVIECSRMGQQLGPAKIEDKIKLWKAHTEEHLGGARDLTLPKCMEGES